jgi:hypothetical protein
MVAIENLARGIGEVAGIAGGATEHLGIRNGAHLAVAVDRMRADDQLVGLVVDHPVGGCAPNRLRADDLPEVRGDLVEFVARAFGHVGRVGDDPQAVSPGHDRSGAAFPFVVEHGEMRGRCRRIRVDARRTASSPSPCVNPGRWRQPFQIVVHRKPIHPPIHS